MFDSFSEGGVYVGRTLVFILASVVVTALLQTI